MKFHVCLCTDDWYIDKAAMVIYSTLFSISKNKEDRNDIIIFHIFHNGISQKNTDLINEFNNQVKKIHPCNIELHLISDKQVQSFNRWGENSSLATYLRLFIPENLTSAINKILYLDCDILCIGDIRPLFNIDLGAAAVACVPDPWIGQKENFVFRSKKTLGLPTLLKFTKNDCYFNAGVLLIDINKWKELEATKKCLDLLSTKRLPLNDQDALNIVFHGKTKLIDFKWNFIGTTTSDISKQGYENCLSRKSPAVVNLVAPFLSCSLKELSIIHYAGSPKPWNGKFSFVEDGKLRLIRPELKTIYNKFAENIPIFSSCFPKHPEDNEKKIIDAIHALGQWTKSIEKKSNRRSKKITIAFAAFFITSVIEVALILTLI